MKDDRWIQGYSCCLANIIAGRGVNTEHEEAFREIEAKYATVKDMRAAGIDDFDIEIFRKVGLIK